MKELLVVVDYQIDFVTGSFGFPAAVLLEQPICKKIRAFHSRGQQVLFTLDTHYAEGFEAEKARHSIRFDAIRRGWELYGEVRTLKTPDTLTISKHVSGSLDLAALLAHTQYDRVEFAGVATNICVLANAAIARAALPDAEIAVDAACTASSDPLLHEKALDVMESLGFIILNRHSGSKQPIQEEPNDHI